MHVICTWARYIFVVHRIFSHYKLRIYLLPFCLQFRTHEDTEKIVVEEVQKYSFLLTNNCSRRLKRGHVIFHDRTWYSLTRVWQWYTILQYCNNTLLRRLQIVERKKKKKKTSHKKLWKDHDASQPFLADINFNEKLVFSSHSH